jgi:hypothetical protein
MFRVTLPDGKVALVAPGETTPNHATVNGLDIEGIDIRYVQVSNDANEISGLGVTHLTGIATFDKPATFRLQRLADGSIRVTTNTGISLNDQWLNGGVRQIEALSLDKQWQDVTAHCQSGSIPTELVRKWSDRNQRTLVDFRVSL